MGRTLTPSRVFVSSPQGARLTCARCIVRPALLWLLGFVFSCTVSSCSSGEADQPVGNRGESPPPGVRVIRAEQRTLEQTVEFTGELLAEHVVEVSPETSGRLTELLVDEGDILEAGALVGRLDSELLVRRRREAQARLDSAEARVEQAEAQRDQQANEVSRRAPLAERNAFPEAELAQLEDALVVAEQAIEVAEAQEDEAEAAVASARAEVNRGDIITPFAGVIAERHVSVGAMVSPQVPIVTLVDETSLHFVLPMAESRLALVSPGTRALVTFDAYPDRQFEASVWRVGRLVDRASRTVEIKLTVEAEGVPLRHGMFGRGVVVARAVEAAIVIPPGAVQRDLEGVERAWVVENDLVRAVEISVVLRTEDALAVTGIDMGALVIVSPPMGLTEGGAVYVVGAESTGGEREGSAP